MQNRAKAGAESTSARPASLCFNLFVETWNAILSEEPGSRFAQDDSVNVAKS